jgi:competence protein ComGC
METHKWLQRYLLKNNKSLEYRKSKAKNNKINFDQGFISVELLVGVFLISWILAFMVTSFTDLHQKRVTIRKKFKSKWEKIK